MNKMFFICAGLFVLGGCSTATPNYDAKFGEAVQMAKQQMIINPQAAQQNAGATGLDGKAAFNSTEQYHRSFKTPPPVTNVISIGGGIGGQ